MTGSPCPVWVHSRRIGCRRSRVYTSIGVPDGRNSHSGQSGWSRSVRGPAASLSELARFPSAERYPAALSFSHAAPQARIS